MNKGRLAVIGVVVVAVAFLAGLVSGTLGRSAAEGERDENHMLLQIQTGVARTLAGRVAIYNVNFGDASREFENARGMFTQARDTLNATDRAADAAVLDKVIALVTEAQRMSGVLDQGANTKAAEAIEALRQISLPERPAAQ